MYKKLTLIVAAGLTIAMAQAAVAAVVVPARVVVVSRPATPVRAATPAPKAATPAKTPQPAMENDANVSNMPPKVMPTVHPVVPANAVNSKCDDKRRQAGECR